MKQGMFKEAFPVEKMICSSCGATLIPNTIQPALVCEYCDTAVANPYYVESDAIAAAQPTLPEMCVQTLVEMGRAENLADVDENCFGEPIQNADTARAAMKIPDGEKLYFLYDHQSLLGMVLGMLTEGIALTDNGLYYLCDGKAGSRSWEAFITGAISCVDRASWQDEGRLSIGTSLSVAVSSDTDSRLARFLIDFHNRVYHKHTGQTAPDSWSVTAGQAQQEQVLAQTVQTGTLAGTVLTAARSLLQRSAAQRHVVQRPTVMRTVKRPEPARHHVQRPEPPRSVRQQPPVHRQQTERPGGMFRPSAGPGGRGGMGGPRGGHGGPGGPGRGRR